MIYFVDEVDFSKEMYGSGGAAVVASAIRVKGNEICFVGATSRNYKLGERVNSSLFESDFSFIPAITMNDLVNSWLNINSLTFAVAIFKYRKTITSDANFKILTQNYLIMWLFVLLGYGKNVCYYFPGLGNPMLIGRKPVLGKLLSAFYEFIHYRLLKKVCCVVAAASCLEVELFNKKQLKKNINVTSLPTPVNTNFFKTLDKHNCRCQLNIDEDAVIFCFLGRLAKVKGIELIIDSISLIKKDIGNVKLLLIGDGEEKETLKTYVISKKLEHNVIFLGNRPPPEVLSFLNASDVAVVSSYVEGFSCAMLEQISVGLPIVSTAVSGSEDMIKEGVNGFIIKNRDPRVFGKRMVDALSLKSASKYSRKLAISKYSEKAMWDKLKDIWRENEK